MKLIIYILFIFYTLCAGEPLGVLSGIQKTPRILLVYAPLTNSLRVGYQGCNPDASSGATSGACMNYFSCILQKGSIQGTCTLGLKACCVFGGGDVVDPVSTTVTSSVPAESTVYNIAQISTSYCQVKIDFTVFELEQPDDTGVCSEGSMVVTPTSNNIPELCGTNSGQHVYLNFDDSTSFQLSVQTNSDNARWTITATQIPCTDTSSLAPDDCLQYFPDSSGTIQSFNFPNLLNPSQTETYQLANTNYEICLGETGTYCSVVYTADTDSTNYAFTVSSNLSALDEGSIGDPAEALSGDSCTTDYVTIENGIFTDSNGNNGTADIYCGPSFYTEVESSTSSSPIRLGVYTDGQEVSNTANPDSGNAGFSLNYELDTC